MQVKDMVKKVESVFEDLYYEWNCIGIRFGTSVYQIGDVLHNSRNNVDREEEREFPAYGTQEYEEMEEMDGVSTWGISGGSKPQFPQWMIEDLNADVSEFMGTHAYIVVGNKVGWEQLNGLVDEGELLIKDGQVALVLY